MGLDEVLKNYCCWLCEWHLESRKDPGDYNDYHENFCCYPDRPNMFKNIKFTIPNQTVYNKGRDSKCPLIIKNKDELINELKIENKKLMDNDSFLKEDFIEFNNKKIKELELLGG